MGSNLSELFIQTHKEFSNLIIKSFFPLTNSTVHIESAMAIVASGGFLIGIHFSSSGLEFCVKSG